MGVGDFFKDIYYSGEEKWYGFWDKVDSAIPIYKVIDPIDSVIPTFALFLIIIFLILLGAGTILVGGVNPVSSTLQLSVVDSQGNYVSGATVNLGSLDQTYTSNDFGLVDDITVPFGSTQSVTAQKGNQKITIPITIDALLKKYELQLPASSASFSQKSIRFSNPDGSLATGEIKLHYTCSSGTADSTPADDTIYGGTANVAQSSECGTLSVTVTSPKYNAATFSLNGPNGNFNLTPAGSSAKVHAVVNLKLSGALISENVNVQAFRTDNSYLPVDTQTTTNGQAQFDLPEGDYKFKVQMQQGYKAEESVVVSLTVASGQKSVDILMEKNILGIISIKTVWGSSIISGVHTVLNKLTSNGLVEVIAKDTNDDGISQFEVAEDANYIIVATKDNYCDASVNVKIGDYPTLSIRAYDGTCGNKLTAQILDQDGKPVSYASAAIFGITDSDPYKLSYVQKIADYNGIVSWNPVKNSNAGEQYKVFAFKSVYSGWSDSKAFNATTSQTNFIVNLTVPDGNVSVTVKDKDGLPVQFSEVQLFDEYSGSAISGKRVVENTDGTISFIVRADKQVYVVVTKDGYESYTSVPMQVVASGNTNFNVELDKPPVNQLQINPLGLFKNGETVLKVEAGQEYDALFEITAPKDYDQLGFFVRVGNSDVAKTELDKLFIKSEMAPGVKTIITGSTYNPPQGYSTDSQYQNLEESKWAQITWQKGDFVQGKIIVGVKVKIRDTAQAEERLEIASRAWGVINGDYERDLTDSELGTSQNSSAKQELYAATKPEYISVGTETLCDSPSADRSFCLTATVTDPDNFTTSFTDGFDAKNNSTYDVSLRIVNNSTVGFDNAKIMIENPEENLLFGDYSIVSPQYVPVSGTLNDYKTDWIDASGFVVNSPIDVVSLKVTPQKTGSGTIRVRIRDNASLIYEKEFMVNISSDKKMTITYMNGDKFQDTLPTLVSGKLQNLTVKAINASDGLEVDGAAVKLYDRFGTLLLTQITNKLGVATIQIPAAFPGEKLVLKIASPEYETFSTDLNIAEDVVTVDPSTLTFTVNPQTNNTDTHTVRITNSTGFDLTVENIVLSGKLKGLLNEGAISSYFESFKGHVIKSQDFEDIPFKVISAPVIPAADDLDGQFEVTISAQGKQWVKDIDTKIRVGLGKDVDLASCLEVTQNAWTATTRGAQVESSFEIRNNCTVDGKVVQLKNLGATVVSTASVTGTFNAQSSTIQVELGSAYARIFKPTVLGGEKVPVTIKFTPMAGSAGVATGSIVFEAQNPTDSKAQKLTAEMVYTINYENLQDCLVVGTDQMTIQEGSSGTFSVTNNCKSKTDIVIDPSDLQGAITNKTFSLNTGETKDITVTANQGIIDGAYNVLIYGRQNGTSLELATNLRTIITPSDASCFALSRYSYDVYDAPDNINPNDGTDRGYLINKCIQKTVSAKITGNVPADTGAIMKMMLWGALVGGATAYFKTDKFLPDSLKGFFDKMGLNISTNLQDAYLTAAQAASSRATSLLNAVRGNLDTHTKEYTDRVNSLTKEATDMNKIILDRNVTISNVCNNSTNYTDTQKVDCLKQANDLAIKDLGVVNTALKNAVTDMNKSLDALKKTNAEVEVAVKQADAAIKGNLLTSKNIQNQEILAGTLNNDKLATNVKSDDVKAAKKLSDSIEPLRVEWNNEANDFKNTLNKYETLDLIGLSKTTDIQPLPLPATQVVVTPAKNNATPAAQNSDEENFDWLFCPDPVDVPCMNITSSSSNNAAVTTTNPITAADIPNFNKYTSDPYTGIIRFNGEKLFTKDFTSQNWVNSQSGNEVVNDPVMIAKLDYILANATRYDLVVPTTVGGLTLDQFKQKCGAKCTADVSIVSTGTTDNFVVKDSSGKALATYTPLQNGSWSVTSSGINTVLNNDFTPSNLAGKFILDTAPSNNTTSSQSNQSSLMNGLLNTAAPAILGLNMPNGLGGAVAGALANGMLSWMGAQDTPVNLSDTFVVPMVVYKSAALKSPDGITMKVNDPTYDYESFNGLQFTGTSASSSTTTSATTQSNGYTGSVLYNPQALSATLGQVEQRELDFTNPAKIVQTDQRKPFIGILSVLGIENVYNTAYKYDAIKAGATARGDYKASTGNFITDFFAPPTNKQALAQMDQNDLTISETRNYSKQFHLIFDSWEYVDCGPKTFPCQAKAVSNCDVDGKKGITGAEAMPKIKLSWSWDAISINACDSDTNPDYIYCDSTQLATSTLKKLLEIQNFFKTTALPSCPNINDILGKTQKLSDNALDVGLTSAQIIPTTSGADINAIVETNNNLPMSAVVSFKVTRADGTEVKVNSNPACADQTVNFTSMGTATCHLNSSAVGVGTFNVAISMAPTLCTGCGNYDTSNDAIQTGVVIGASSVGQCQGYSTNYDYFQKVLGANNQLTTDAGKKMLSDISFKVNLERDGFTKDFKNDYDTFISQLAGAPDSYRSSGLRDLFLSDKFSVNWPAKGSAPWEAGKYDAKLIITFKNSSWKWDNNNIDSVVLDLQPQGDPDPNFSIYNVAFDGPVGLASEDGRQGYGAGYIQKTEDLFTVTKDSYSDILAQPNTKNNAVTSVNVSVIKGAQAFDLLNSTPTRGNVLSIYRTGDNVDFTITPSVAVPLILDVTRKTGVDAYGFYSAEVDGQPQELGSSFISWTGIGQGCVTFDGSPMQAYYNTPDYKANSVLTGFDGYGLYWPMAKVAGTASFYGQFFAPQDASTILKMTGAKDSATFESTYGNGNQLAINPNGGIKTLRDVLDLVAAQKVCVIGGDYYWNNTGITTDLKDTINAKENTCISSQ